MQKSVASFISKHGLQADAQTRYIDLTSEIGELGKEILKGTGYGEHGLEITAQTEGELGDCLFSLIALAVSLGIDADSALQGALEKYGRRLALGGSAGSDAIN